MLFICEGKKKKAAHWKVTTFIRYYNFSWNKMWFGVFFFSFHIYKYKIIHVELSYLELLGQNLYIDCLPFLQASLEFRASITKYEIIDIGKKIYIYIWFDVISFCVRGISLILHSMKIIVKVTRNKLFLKM